jgi:predicted PurR-regulated permease PerM
MKKEYVGTAVFAAIVIIVCYLFFVILRPFLKPIIWGAVFAGVFYPLNARIACKLRKKNLRALIMCIIVVALIGVPATFLFVGLIGEVVNVFPRFREAIDAGQLDFILKPESFGWNEKIKEVLAPFVDVSNLDVEMMVTRNLQRLTDFFLAQVSNTVGNISLAVFNFALSVMSMFFFFRDGDRLLVRLRELMPMSEGFKADLSVRLSEVIRASIYGGVLVAGLQGALGGILFWVLGLPSPIFWGAVMAVLSLLPIVGPWFVYLPAAAILFLSGSYVRGGILLALGIVIVSQSDNLVRPLIIGSRTKIPTLLLLFSILGGIKMFGLLGLVLGPVIASILLAFLEVYRPRSQPGGPCDSVKPRPSRESSRTSQGPATA